MAPVKPPGPAKAVLHDLSTQYRAALQEYCATGGEAALHGAYQLGRQAILSGFGALEIMGLHQEGLAGLPLDGLEHGEHARIERRASEFLAECLAPFELSRRGFADAHAALSAANQGLQRQLVEQRKVAQERSDVIGVVSHEMRTPLTSIHGSLSLLKAGMGGELNADGRRLLEVACRNSERLVRLVNDVLDLERLESGTMTFNMRPFALRRLLEDAVEANSAYATPCGVTLALRVVPAGARVRVDGDQFMQVMANLLSNAVKFSRAGDSVEIEAERAAGRVRVSVVDHGPGVPPGFERRIFQKFAQAENAEGRKGSGLGLSITRAILENMGGDIGFTLEGGRTVFHFELPEWRARSVGGPRLTEDDPCLASR
jgi:signal transduction histidine kinase